MQRSSVIKAIRVTHRYLGLLFAPAIVFFAFSGAMQVMGWHQTTRGSSYVPPRWIVEMAQIHKKQTLALPAPKAQKPADDAGDTRNAPMPRKPKESGSKFVMQCFVFVMSIALAATTLLGIVMAFLYGGDRRITCLAVLAGMLFPLAILFL
ncbi:hypothetical protein [Paracidobacterium acidisoli]|uniref:PepSY domain-containing protein n=1 Tax=Paracidobacterium acidisoli TaxID=2303751 RepID=A0A372IRV5_9BACT|nr:hypothetical protein [Paracidobacterium acidisoli]MBT9330612.1 hypothetical protein [Paracidobacterium acidisoli]